MKSGEKEALSVSIVRRILEADKTPKFIVSGSTWFRFDDMRGWCACKQSDVKDFVVQFILRNVPILYNARMVADVLDALRAIWKVSDGGAVRSWFVSQNSRWLRLDATPANDWISFENVLLNVKSLEVRPFSSLLFTLGRVPCAYNPAAKCPRWVRFLDEILDKEAQRVLQEFFGVSLTYDRSFQGFAILIGDGGNGKGVVLQVLQEMNKGAYCAVSLQDLGNRFEKYALTENRVNIDNDANSRVTYEKIPEIETTLKKCSAGESVQVEKKGVDSESRIYIALLIFATNPPAPLFLDGSKGIVRRVRFIPFEHCFTGTAKENNHLGEELKEELSGVVNWSLAGYQSMLKSGQSCFSDCEGGKRLMNQESKERKPERMFFDDEVLKVDGEKISAEKLYTAYCNWYDLAGFSRLYRLTRPELTKRVKEYLGVSSRREQIHGIRDYYIYGLELVQDLKPNAAASD